MLKGAAVGMSLMISAAVVPPSALAASELAGARGDRLRGSISCIHPNLVYDLIDRVEESENYTFVLRFHVQRGHCVEADIPTILEKPLAGQTFTTWDGHEAEIWQTTLEFARGDGTTESLQAWSIVFPREMKQVKQAARSGHTGGALS